MACSPGSRGSLRLMPCCCLPATSFWCARISAPAASFSVAPPHEIIAYSPQGRCPMSWRAAYVMGSVVVFFGFWPATIAKADDQQLVQDYLATRGAMGAVVRPITDDYVGRTFQGFSFFGVI